MKRALITGMGGSIGVHVWCHLMHNTDWEVVGLDSFRHMGLSERIVEAAKAHPQWLMRTKCLTHDLTAPIGKLLSAQIGKIDYIINLASLSDVYASLMDPVPFFTNNVAIALNMLEFAREIKPRVFLQISSDEVYGPTDGTHQHKEWDPILPSSPYSASKAAQEAAAIAWWRSFDVPVVIVNLMNNFGEMQNPHKFPVLIQKNVAAGRAVTVHGNEQMVGTRYYIHSRNAADAMLFMLTNVVPTRHTDGNIDRPSRFNVVGDVQINNADLAVLIAKHMDMPVTIQFEDFHSARPGHDRHYGLDGSKLALWGWTSPRSFDETLAEVVKWQTEHPEWIEQ